MPARAIHLTAHWIDGLPGQDLTANFAHRRTTVTLRELAAAFGLSLREQKRGSKKGQAQQLTKLLVLVDFGD